MLKRVVAKDVNRMEKWLFKGLEIAGCLLES